MGTGGCGQGSKLEVRVEEPLGNLSGRNGERAVRKLIAGVGGRGCGQEGGQRGGCGSCFGLTSGTRWMSREQRWGLLGLSWRDKALGPLLGGQAGRWGQKRGRKAGEVRRWPRCCHSPLLDLRKPRSFITRSLETTSDFSKAMGAGTGDESSFPLPLSLGPAGCAESRGWA